MCKRKICFIAQFPPPIHGLSKAVDTLYNSNLKDEFEFEKVDITSNKNFLYNIFFIIKSRADLYYFTISQTKWGNIRDLIILKILSLQKKKCLVHLHGGYYREMLDKELSSWQRKCNYNSIKNLEGAIVLSKSLRTIFQGLLPESKIYIVPNCIDNQYLMSEKSFNQKIMRSYKCKVKNVLYLSNFIKEKGYREVLKLAKLEKEQTDKKGIRYHFHFAGKFFDETEETYFWNYIRGNKLENIVSYYGVVDGDKKRELLQKCDYFILLTRYAKEGQPISILEAMGNGMAVITTNHAGIPDIVEDNINGIVVKVNDNIEDIFERMSSISFKEVAFRNRNEVLKRYKETMYISNMREYFNKCCGIK